MDEHDAGRVVVDGAGQDPTDFHYTPPIKLNIGGGNPEDDHYSDMGSDWTLIDRSQGHEAFPMPGWGDDSVDEIYASHVLEHFPYEKVPEVIAEWVRILKPGGRIYIAVPNFTWIAEQHLAQTGANVQGFLMGGHMDENDHHGATFDRAALKLQMSQSGLERIGDWTSSRKDCAALPVSLNLMGFKAGSPPTALPNVRACLAAPRVGFTVHFRCLLQSFWQLSIPCDIITGCFWHQQLSECMERQLAEGAEYILTLDYDTICSAQDVMELYRLLQAYPEADAVCALQSKRGEETVLLGLSKEEQERGATPLTFAGEMTRIATGHFGCTLIRAEALKEMDKPWMCPEPSSEGTWNRDDDHIDADITFWHNWKASNKTLFSANRVVIGHLQELILWPAKNFGYVHQDIRDYTKNGIPADVRR